jgi:hypothetical protein
VWTKVNDWLLETDCGTYRCRKYRTGDDVMTDPGEIRYQLYGPNGQRLGPPQESFAACKRWLAERTK